MTPEQLESFKLGSNCHLDAVPAMQMTSTISLVIKRVKCWLLCLMEFPLLGNLYKEFLTPVAGSPNFTSLSLSFG
jgi:hypothetical protein